MNTLWAVATKLTGSARPLRRPMVANSICPPSSTGTGRRFRIARLTLMKIVNRSTDRRPASAAAWKIRTMPTGPGDLGEPDVGVGIDERPHVAEHEHERLGDLLEGRRVGDVEGGRVFDRAEGQGGRARRNDEHKALAGAHHVQAARAAGSAASRSSRALPLMTGVPFDGDDPVTHEEAGLGGGGVRPPPSEHSSRSPGRCRRAAACRLRKGAGGA